VDVEFLRAVPIGFVQQPKLRNASVDRKAR
jgi:hypothetical protein